MKKGNTEENQMNEPMWKSESTTTYFPNVKKTRKKDKKAQREIEVYTNFRVNLKVLDDRFQLKLIELALKHKEDFEDYTAEYDKEFNAIHDLLNVELKGK